MSINADVLKKAVVHSRTGTWCQDRSKKFEMLYLDLLDTVKPVATMLVRMPPSTMLAGKKLLGGKEVFVLEGTFQDERGSYPVNSYMRFPPGCRQEAYSDSGCLLFVKTWQFDKKDQNQVNIDTSVCKSYRPKGRHGVHLQHIYSDAREDVRIERWDPNHRLKINQCNGLEIMVLDGEFFEPSTAYRQHSWLRIPPEQPLSIIVGDKPAKVLIKESHLVRAVPGRVASNVSGAELVKRP